MWQTSCYAKGGSLIKGSSSLHLFLPILVVRSDIMILGKVSNRSAWKEFPLSSTIMLNRDDDLRNQKFLLLHDSCVFYESPLHKDCPVMVSGKSNSLYVVASFSSEASNGYLPKLKLLPLSSRISCLSTKDISVKPCSMGYSILLKINLSRVIPC